MQTKDAPKTGLRALRSRLGDRVATSSLPDVEGVLIESHAEIIGEKIHDENDCTGARINGGWICCREGRGNSGNRISRHRLDAALSNLPKTFNLKARPQHGH